MAPKHLLLSVFQRELESSLEAVWEMMLLIFRGLMREANK
jgi:hypothetical protein